MSEIKTENPYEVYAKVNRSEMLPFIPETAQRILDVGCGVGNFGEVLKSKRAVEVWGIEPNKDAADIAARKLDNAICGLFDENSGLPAKHFDCIVFNDVLEHMVDPHSALLYAKQLLRDNGKIVASIPNVRYFDNLWTLVINRDWEYVDAGILDRTHLRFFTVNSIPTLFRNADYRIDSMKGINSLKYCNPERMKQYRIINNLLLLNSLRDTYWLQFAVVASPNA